MQPELEVLEEIMMRDYLPAKVPRTKQFSANDIQIFSLSLSRIVKIFTKVTIIATL